MLRPTSYKRRCEKAASKKFLHWKSYNVWNCIHFSSLLKFQQPGTVLTLISLLNVGCDNHLLWKYRFVTCVDYFARGSDGEVLWSVASVFVRLSLCMSVCLSDRISPEPHARHLPNFSACCLWPCLCPPPVGWRNPRGSGNFGGFPPIDNAL